MKIRKNPKPLMSQMYNHKVSIRTESVELPVTSVEEAKGKMSDFLLVPTSFHSSKNMGGPRKRTEPHKFDSLCNNEELWSLFEQAGFTHYFVAMEGYNERLSYKFANSWRDREVTLGGLQFKVDAKLIADAMGLAYEDMKVVKVSNGKYQDYFEKNFEGKEKPEFFQNGYSMVKLPLCITMSALS